MGKPVVVIFDGPKGLARVTRFGVVVAQDEIAT
jgi:hypothetical protein